MSRRKSEDKKLHLDLYVKSSEIEAIGAEKAKEVSYSAISKEVKKSLKKSR